MTHVIDARGMRCPWPAIRLTRALREEHRSITIMADDPAADRELTMVAHAAGASINRVSSGLEPIYHVIVPVDVNTSFTRDV